MHAIAAGADLQLKLGACCSCGSWLLQSLPASGHFFARYELGADDAVHYWSVFASHEGNTNLPGNIQGSAAAAVQVVPSKLHCLSFSGVALT